MPVVSYAIPALVAIGQAKFYHSPPKNPLARLVRNVVVNRTRRVLASMQPQSGGYLEATPLTSFVLMNLSSIGQANSQVAMDCRKFLLDSVQSDGSWPIDTNLATWVTSLAIHGLVGFNDSTIQSKTIDWLLSCQHFTRHPFTGAEPGGWGWTNLSGAVPDADDTPAALIALHEWRENHVARVSSSLHMKIQSASQLGVEWLLKLQNRDGGWPTFCRGWGQLPFDRSGADLTAHALRALIYWLPKLPNESRSIQRSIQRGIEFLIRQQRPDGSWLPLWFGNQDLEDDINPYYGTGKVLLAFAAMINCARSMGSCDQRIIKATELGLQFLIQNQNEDGGWGGGSSISYPSSENTSSSTIEETSVAIEAITDSMSIFKESNYNNAKESLDRGMDWLVARIENDDCTHSQPIGFYFAKLWYHEQLYPYVFAAAALKKWIAVIP